MDSAFLALAAAQAEQFIGATAPNPPVGACLVRDGKVLALGAHEKAGCDHAEIVALKHAFANHGADAVRGATLYVTLEPCNHHGKTPPCVNAILESGVARVVFGYADPNPAASGGHAALTARNVVAELLETEECRELIRPFEKHQRTGLPWVTHKLAYRVASDGKLTMLPESGAATFTREQSLAAAHDERRKSDAILTDVATVLADAPRFNVRHVLDHVGRRRTLAVLSRSGRNAPETWIARQQELGFEVTHFTHPLETLEALGRQGALRVLVEAGPTLSAVFEREKLWDERVVFLRGPETDMCHREVRCSRES